MYFFAGVILKYGDAITMTENCHGLLCKVVEKKTGIPELDSAPYRIILQPRGTGKSVLITQSYVLQEICRDPNIAFLIANEKMENAVAFLGAIKVQIEQNELLRALFPEIVPANTNMTTWSTEAIVVPRTTTRREPTIKVTGAGAALASMHPDKIIVDDMVSVEAAENARRGDGGLTQIANRWIAQLVPLLNGGYEPRPEITFAATRWYRGDPYEQLPILFGYGQEVKTWTLGIKLASGEIRGVPVTRQGDLVTYSRKVIEDGKPLWPERPGYDIESLAKMRLTDPALFAANMMNDPSDDVTATFKEAWLQFYQWNGEQQITYFEGDALPRAVDLQDMDRLMIVDPGGFARNRSLDKARGAIIVTGTTTTGPLIHSVLDCYSEQVTYQFVAQKVLDMAVRYTPRRVYVEEVAQQATFMDLLKRMAAERNIQVSFEAILPKNEQKDARILGLESYFQRGQIRFGTGPQFHELREQYRSWPCPRVDLLDALAYGPRVWRQPIVRQVSQHERQRRERESFYAKARGVAPKTLPS